MQTMRRQWKYLQLLCANPRVLFSYLISNREGGFFLFLAMLLFEFILIHPFQVTTSVARLWHNPLSGIIQLWGNYVRFALPFVVVMFGLGVIFYLLVRVRYRAYFGRSLDLFEAAGLVAYAWFPHTIIIALGVMIFQWSGPHSMLPQALGAQLTPVLMWLKWGYLYAPVVLLVIVLIQSLWRLEEQEQELNQELGREHTDQEKKLRLLSFVIKRSRKVLFGGVMFLCVWALLFNGIRVANSWSDSRPPLPGDPVPAFVLHGEHGEVVDERWLLGSVTVIDFWATWCGPCVAAMPALDQLNRELKAEGLRLLSVNVEGDSPANAYQFAASHDLSFPVFVDSGAMGNTFQVDTLPTVIVVDKHGIIRDVHIGAFPQILLKNTILRLLKE